MKSLQILSQNCNFSEKETGYVKLKSERELLQKKIHGCVELNTK